MDADPELCCDHKAVGVTAAVTRLKTDSKLIVIHTNGLLLLGPESASEGGSSPDDAAPVSTTNTCATLLSEPGVNTR